MRGDGSAGPVTPSFRRGCRFSRCSTNMSVLLACVTAWLCPHCSWCKWVAPPPTGGPSHYSAEEPAQDPSHGPCKVSPTSSRTLAATSLATPPSVHLLRPHEPDCPSLSFPSSLSLWDIYVPAPFPHVACSLVSGLCAHVISGEKTLLTTLSMTAALPLPLPPHRHLSLFSFSALSSPDIVIKYASLLFCLLSVSVW